MANLTLEELQQRYAGCQREGVYYWLVPKVQRFWDRPRWLDVTRALAGFSDDELDILVRATPHLYYASMVPLEDRSFDRFLARAVRRRKLRDKLLAFYRPDRRLGPGPLFDAAVVALVMVLGTAQLFV